MALNREEYLAVLRHLQAELRERDPDLSSYLSEMTGQVAREVEEPRIVLLQALRTVADRLQERSLGSYRQTVNLLNEYIDTEDGEGIEGVRVAITEQERELYDREYIELSELPEQNYAVAELEEIIQELREGQ